MSDVNELKDIQDDLRNLAKKMCEERGWDTMQIVVSFLNPDGSTATTNGGWGNWYARVGTMRQMIVRDDAEETFGPITEKLT